MFSNEDLIWFSRTKLSLMAEASMADWNLMVALVSRGARDGAWMRSEGVRLLRACSREEIWCGPVGWLESH